MYEVEHLFICLSVFLSGTLLLSVRVLTFFLLICIFAYIKDTSALSNTVADIFPIFRCLPFSFT